MLDFIINEYKNGDVNKALSELTQEQLLNLICDNCIMETEIEISLLSIKYIDLDSIIELVINNDDKLTPYIRNIISDKVIDKKIGGVNNMHLANIVSKITNSNMSMVNRYSLLSIIE